MNKSLKHAHSGTRIDAHDALNLLVRGESVAWSSGHRTAPAMLVETTVRILIARRVTPAANPPAASCKTATDRHLILFPPLPASSAGSPIAGTSARHAAR